MAPILFLTMLLCICSAYGRYWKNRPLFSYLKSLSLLCGLVFVELYRLKILQFHKIDYAQLTGLMNSVGETASVYTQIFAENFHLLFTTVIFTFLSAGFLLCPEKGKPLIRRWKRRGSSDLKRFGPEQKENTSVTVQKVFLVKRQLRN